MTTLPHHIPMTSIYSRNYSTVFMSVVWAFLDDLSQSKDYPPFMPPVEEAKAAVHKYLLAIREHHKKNRLNQDRLALVFADPRIDEELIIVNRRREVVDWPGKEVPYCYIGYAKSEIPSEPEG